MFHLEANIETGIKFKKNPNSEWIIISKSHSTQQEFMDLLKITIARIEEYEKHPSTI